MKKIILLLICTFLSQLSFSQVDRQLIPNRSCGTMEADAALRLKYPELGTMNDFENWLQQKIVESKANRTTDVTTIFNIPVVVHVMHSNTNLAIGNYNITQAQINSQITVLNQDYNKLNADSNKIPPVFRPFAANIQINFCLAQVDPNGAQMAEPGIDRIYAPSKGVFLANLKDDYITNSIKPVTIWDPRKYLNIWTVPDMFPASGGNMLLGFATFPGSSTLPGLNSPGTLTNDGVVIWYKAFGTTGTLDGTYNKGRTATHEIGHWLGLRHTWGDGTCNAGDNSDFCDDTPPTNGANFGCPVFPLIVGHQNQAGPSCSAVSPGAMYMDYMDYVDDNCMQMFTNDQKTRIVTVMTNSPFRIALNTSTVCNVVGVAENATDIVKANFYPNPSNGFFQLDLKLKNKSNVDIKVFSTIGKLVYETTKTDFNQGLMKFDLSALSQGIYFVEISSAKGKSTQKINITH